MFNKINIIILMSVIGMGVAHSGSLFDDSSYRSLVSDNRASKVGQSLTVLIYEQASAASTADTDTSKESSVGANASVFGDSENKRYGADVGLNSNFSGGGVISRTGNVVASISVTVQEVLPTGEFRIAGEQWVNLNNEQQEISVSGVIRPQDISVDNTIPSTRLSNAVIDYIGDGLLGERQTPGVLTQFFNWLF